MLCYPQDLEKAAHVVLTGRIDDRPATAAERNVAYDCVVMHCRGLAETILHAYGVPNAHHDAQEIAQAFVMMTLLGIIHFDSERSAKAFAEGVVRKLCKAHCRVGGRMAPLPDGFDVASDQLTYEDRLVATDVLQFIAHAVTRLTELQHKVIEDLYWEALTAKESALKRGESKRSIEHARQKAREILVRAFNAHGIDDWVWKLFD